ncbi:MAG: hypothetical protein HYW77_01580 [Parcubacteria group bacterium]|nr:hypothetical protein [Parcubacteria group bacterium]
MYWKAFFIFLILIFNTNFSYQWWPKQPNSNSGDQKIQVGESASLLPQFLILYFPSTIRDDQIKLVLLSIDKSLKQIRKSRKDDFFGFISKVSRNIIHKYPDKPEVPGYIAVEVVLVVPITKDQKKFDLSSFLAGFSSLAKEGKSLNLIPFAGQFHFNSFIEERFDNVTQSKYFWLKPLCFYAEFKVVTNEFLHSRLSSLSEYTDKKDWNTEDTTSDEKNEAETLSRETLYVDCYFRISDQDLIVMDKTRNFQAEVNILSDIEVKKVFTVVIKAKTQKQEESSQTDPLLNPATAGFICFFLLSRYIGLFGY